MIENILELKMTDDLVLALENSGFTDLDQVGMMIGADTGRLVVPDPTNNTTTNLNDMFKRTMLLLIVFFTRSGVDIDDHTSFMALTSKDWKDFKRDQRANSRSSTPSALARKPLADRLLLQLHLRHPNWWILSRKASSGILQLSLS